jgi:hypothetical protein
MGSIELGKPEVFTASDKALGRKLLEEWETDPNALNVVYGALARSDYRRASGKDYGLHTCQNYASQSVGLRVLNPERLDEKQFLNADHLRSLSELYEKLSFDMELFSESVGRARNLWPYFAARRSLNPNDVPNVDRTDLAPYFDVIAPRQIEKCVDLISTELWQGIGTQVNIYGGSPRHWRVIGQEHREHTAEQKIQLVKEHLFAKFALENYICTHGDLGKCVNCLKKFPPDEEVKLPRRGIYGKLCSTCLSASRPSHGTRLSKPKLWAMSLFGVKNYVNVFGEVPTASKNIYDVLSSDFATLSDGNLRLAFRSFMVLPWQMEGLPRWPELLNLAGVLNGKRVGFGGYESIATDGHHCLSSGERAVCEYLSSVGIKHIKEAPYPIHPDFNAKGMLRTDFKIGNIILEYAGRLQNSDYAKRIEIKRQLAESTGHIFVEINPSNIGGIAFLVSNALESQGFRN